MTSRTGSILRDTMIEVISDQRTWLDLVEAAGELIAADAKLNAWMVDWAKAHLSQDELLSVVDVYEDVTETCSAEWRVLQSDATRGEAQRRFLSVVRGAIGRIATVVHT